MDNIEREGVINLVDWLEEDTRQELRQEERKDYLKLKAKLFKMKAFAVSEMYRAIEEMKDDRDKCLMALGKAHLCYRMGFISKSGYSEIRDYLKRKAREQTDWKALYEDLQQHYQRELMESEYWSKEFESVSCALDDLSKQNKE